MTSRLATGALRVLTLLMVLLLILCQAVLLPLLARDTAEAAPEYAFLMWPLLIAAWVVLACVESILVALWALLNAVDRDRIFDGRAFRWTRIITVSAGVATLACLAVTVGLLATPGVGPITVHLMTVTATITGAAVTLLMLVMTALLKKATALRTELAEVI